MCMYEMFAVCRLPGFIKYVFETYNTFSWKYYAKNIVVENIKHDTFKLHEPILALVLALILNMLMLDTILRSM